MSKKDRVRLIELALMKIGCKVQPGLLLLEKRQQRPKVFYCSRLITAGR